MNEFVAQSITMPMWMLLLFPLVVLYLVAKK